MSAKKKKKKGSYFLTSSDYIYTIAFPKFPKHVFQPPIYYVNIKLKKAVLNLTTYSSEY